MSPDRRRSPWIRNVNAFAAALAVACGVLAAGNLARAADDDREAPVSTGAKLAAATLRLSDGYTAQAVASEPLLENPVSFCFDPNGRIFIAEAHRIKHGTEDNRDHMDWLDDDLAARTVEDRRAYITKRMGDRIGFYTEASELVRLVEDRDGDGAYDHSHVFADQFHDIVDGAAAGVLWMGDRLLFTCIPTLWELPDANHDGRADAKRALATGFGVHFALFGHDLHGLCLGPDGRVYFSIGDRGFDVQTPSGPLSNIVSGSVLRCRPDGSEFEVFATGLRNPQELVFNEWGDLFSVDNNSDWGDRARVVHIVEGQKTGWRMSYQYLRDRGPFTRERIWELQNDEQPASIIPPLAHLTDGPSGLVYYPGTGLKADCAGGFFVCDFLGASSRSGVREFHLEQSGASYKLASDSMFVRGVLATDCDFGPDGNFYVSDWLEGWNGTGKGRIYRVETDDPKAVAERAELRTLMAAMEKAGLDKWLSLLSNANMRVRLAAQRQLVALGESAAPPLQSLATKTDAPLLARVHAIWALTQLAEQNPKLYDALAALLNDAEPEIRNQAARSLGAARSATAAQRTAFGAALVARLADDSPRVKCSAAIALGKLGPSSAPALAALLKLARDNAGDPVLRHAAVMGLAGTQTPEALVAAAKGASVAEQLAVVVALSRSKSPLVAKLLTADSERVVLEAARAIWDTPIEAAYSQLAELVDDPRLTSDPLLRRALAASLTVGTLERLQAVALCGLRADVPAAIRELAWQTVSQWSAPSPRDPVHGSWRPIAARPAAQTLLALKTMWTQILAASKTDGTGVVVAAELGMPEALASLMAIVEQHSHPAALRARAVDALSGAEDAIVLQAIDAALASSEVDLRLAARRLLVKRFPDRAVEPLCTAAESNASSMLERQDAIQMLGRLPAPAAAKAVMGWFDRVEKGACPPELVLDALEAAAASTDPALLARQKGFADRQMATGPAAVYAMCADGGDATRGEQVFAAKAELACKRCHSLKPGAVLVGPSLADVGLRRKRAELLESIVAPNAKIVEGFQTTSLLLDTGKAVAGILRRDDGKNAVLIDPDGKEILVDLSTVEERSQGLSAMPEDIVKHMTRSELRDLVAYLATLQTELPAGAIAPPAPGASATQTPGNH